MTIKLIATDMDGTFLRDDHTYDHRRFKHLFHQLKKRHIRFVAASGSSFPRLAREFQPYVDQMDFISQNGSVIHHGQHFLAAYPIEVTALERVMHILDRFYGPKDINQLVVSGTTTSYVDWQMDAANYAIVKLFYEEVVRVPDIRRVFSEYPNERFTKISINFAQHIDLNRVAAVMDGYLPPSLIIENSGFNTDLIGNAQGTKRNALAVLQRQLHLQDDEIVTFGDNENDLGMLAMTDRSYAMQNANPVIKLQAAHTTAIDNNHDGVIQTIEQLLKNDR